MFPETFSLYWVVIVSIVCSKVVDPIAIFPSEPRIAREGVDDQVDPPAAVDGVISKMSLPINWLPTLKFLYPEEPRNNIAAPELSEASRISNEVENLPFPETSKL